MNTISNTKMVRLVTGDKTEVISENQAYLMAKEQNMDLVILDDRSDIPVVKIMDEGKYNYEIEKRKKRLNKQQKQKQVKLKEVQLRPVTGDNDIKIKSKNINEFLSKGHNVKISVKFRGRENTHIDMGKEVISKLLSYISGYNIVHDTRNSGKEITVIVEPVKE